MQAVLSLVLALGLGQAASDSPAEPVPPQASVSEQSAARAAESAERAARAAQSAAESAERAAKAAQQLAEAAAPKAAAPEAAPAAQAPVPETKEVAWSGVISAGLISLTGNAQSITTTGALSATRQSEDWIFALKANGAYGQTRPQDPDLVPETVALNALLELRADRRLSELFAIYLLAGASTDHVKSIEALPYGEAGLSILWLDELEDEFSVLKLQTDLAFRYGDELRFQYYPTVQDIEDVLIAAPKLGVAFRYALTRDVIFTEDLEVLPTVLGPSRVLVNSTTKLSARLIAALSLGVSFVVKHDSRPAEGKVPTDTALNVGLDIGF